MRARAVVKGHTAVAARGAIKALAFMGDRVFVNLSPIRGPQGASQRQRDGSRRAGSDQPATGSIPGHKRGLHEPRSSLRLVAALAAAIPAQSMAQAPLSIEQLLMDAQHWQLTAGFDHYGRSAAGFDEQIERAMSTALRYGVRPGVEVNATYTRAESTQRLPGSRTASVGESLALGLNWQLRREDAWPALVLELRGDLWQTRDEREMSLPAGSVAVTAYRTIDPVVLSLRAAYRHQRPMRREEARLQPGAAWTLEPNVSFAVNPRVTLIGGLALTREGATRLDDRALFRPRYQRALRAGIAYAPWPRSTLFLIGDIGTTATGGGLSLQWFHEFR